MGMFPAGVTGPRVVFPGTSRIRRSWKAAKGRINSQALREPNTYGNTLVLSICRGPSLAATRANSSRSPSNSTMILMKTMAKTGQTKTRKAGTNVEPVTVYETACLPSTLPVFMLFAVAVLSSGRCQAPLAAAVRRFVDISQLQMEDDQTTLYT